MQGYTQETLTNPTTDLRERGAMDSKTAKARRKLLKAMLASGGAVTTAKALPEKWTAPIINSTIVPAHAQTTK